MRRVTTLCDIFILIGLALVPLGSILCYILLALINPITTSLRYEHSPNTLWDSTGQH